MLGALQLTHGLLLLAVIASMLWRGRGIARTLVLVGTIIAMAVLLILWQAPMSYPPAWLICIQYFGMILISVGFLAYIWRIK
ncbi:hypothetical protein [Cerasicoccus frondis]|uniref:hypothetical protein n=1 Tax=Cerasicoccus frondis TaxID=490090 RepID=UPI002852C2B1|nr:hypothetical protein [Cerasicoccus frondis]